MWSPPIGSSLVKRTRRSPASASSSRRSQIESEPAVAARRPRLQTAAGAEQQVRLDVGRRRRGGPDPADTQRRSTRSSPPSPKAAAGLRVPAHERVDKVEAHLAMQRQHGAGDASVPDARHAPVGTGEQRDARRCIDLKTGSISMRTRARASPPAGACPGSPSMPTVIVASTAVPAA